MTDKERLEDIKTNYEYNHENTEWKVIALERSDLEWLIEQAERVQYLEETKAQALRINQKEMRCRWDISSQLADSKRENKRYREALEDLKSRAMNVSPEREDDGSIIEDEESRFLYEFCSQALEDIQ